MPFVALDKISGDRIDITEISNPKIILNNKELLCQLCQIPMGIKASKAGKISPHFFHSSACTSSYNSHPESAEHRFGKKYVGNLITKIFNNHFDCKIEKEFPIDLIKRVIDLVAIYPCGWIWANEIQL